jgi:hypothetical protein
MMMFIGTETLVTQLVYESFCVFVRTRVREFLCVRLLLQMPSLIVLADAYEFLPLSPASLSEMAEGGSDCALSMAGGCGGMSAFCGIGAA